MKPWIATSFPLYDLIVSVTSESARIASTSSAKVKRGTSSVPACAAIGTFTARKTAASQVPSFWVLRVGLGQRRKIFRNLRAIGKHSRQQAGQSAQDNNPAENGRFEDVEAKRVRDQPARPEQRPGKIGNDVS